MVKKRLIFTLIHSQKRFMLSRNFTLQQVGDINWLNTNYKFSKVATSFDEIILLDATRGEKNISDFAEQLTGVIDSCFIPVAAGGGIRSLKDAQLLLNSGADKVVLILPLQQIRISFKNSLKIMVVNV